MLTYVDPGSGFVFLQNTNILWGLILGLAGFLFIFFSFFFRFLKKFFWFFFILLLVAIIGVIIMSKPSPKKKVIILGIDAMDAAITEKLIKEGRLPNLNKLKASGAYLRLSTTIPAESVVAWTSFSTGLNPGAHGIYDFVMRDPRTYSLYLTLNDSSNVHNKIEITVRRHGEPFWSTLSSNKVSSFIYFCPNTFPPEKVSGVMLSGMGVPDLYGTMGRFSFYTSEPLDASDKESRGKIIHVQLIDNKVVTDIYGPKINNSGRIIEAVLPLKINVSADKKKISLEFQGKNVFLEIGKWSEWQKICFKVSRFQKINGIVKFYLKSTDPELKLYMSPINFDPERPPFPISYPFNYSARLAKKIGLYYTQGMPHDTWALTEGRLGEEEFLEETNQILAERKKILQETLGNFKDGLFFFYFDTLDVVQHMFWRYLDPKHPLHEGSPLYKDVIFKYYEEFDRIVAEVLKKIDKDTALIVLSDHGFSSFRRSVHLNRWLLENNYLSLKDGLSEGGEFFEGVDWARTKAYALGFGGIYLNRSGREGHGIVSDSEVDNLKREIAEKLKSLRDPQSGERVFNNVYLGEEIFKGPYINEAPDLFVGFNAGYRASWQTALGGAPAVLIEDNRKKWSGDHLVDPGLAPGIIFINKKIELENPSIIDIAPTILGLFDINKSIKIPGNVLFKDEDK